MTGPNRAPAAPNVGFGALRARIGRGKPRTWGWGHGGAGSGACCPERGVGGTAGPDRAPAAPNLVAQVLGYSKSMELKKRSLESWWRALTRRTVPDLERMTSDCVVAPRLS